jgi:hypothetical protein
MTTEEILKKALAKATDNGFVLGEHPLGTVYLQPSVGYVLDVFGNKCPVIYTFVESPSGKETKLGSVDYRVIIFDHSFAKALWGTSPVECNLETLGIVSKKTKDNIYYEVAYLHHLQNMVIADDPIAYLGTNL